MSDSHQNQEDYADGIQDGHNKAPGYFYVLFFGLIIWGVIFMAYFLLSGWSSAGEFKEKMEAHTGQPVQDVLAVSPEASETQPMDAKSLYSANCAGCHGDDATGGFGTDLTAATYQFGKAPADIKESISAGRGGSMPGFSGPLSETEIDSLVEYLLKL